MALPLQPYPTDLADAPRVLLAKLTGGDVPLCDLMQAGYHVLGYGLGVAFPHDHDGHPVFASTACEPVSHAELCDELRKLDRPTFGAEADAAGAVPWASIITTLLPLLLSWLSKK
jgi:hypothetical protein